MVNYLKMQKRQQVIALLELGWTYRRIERETGVRRETISRYDRIRQATPAKVFPGWAGGNGPERAEEASPDPNAAKVFPGSGANPAKVFPGPRTPARSVAAAYEEAIREKLDQGLTLQRIWQDLVEEFGYPHSYESVKRYARRLERPKRRVGVYHHAPGEEGQIDFFAGAPTFHEGTGRWKKPWVFRMTLCHSRHGYEEAVWDQQLETFLRLHENAFRELGGVPRVTRHDNIKAAVVRACLFDPDTHPIYAAFAEHWGFTPLPTRPANPQENGKQERSGGYVKSNALKGKRFASLREHNDHLRHWNRTWARVRIHGTTRRQVWTHYLESVSRPWALWPRNRSRSSGAATISSTPTGTWRWTALSTPPRMPFSANGSRFAGTAAWFVSSTRGSSWPSTSRFSGEPSPRAAPGTRLPPRSSTSRNSWDAANAWENPCAAGRKRPWPSGGCELSAPSRGSSAFSGRSPANGSFMPSSSPPEASSIATTRSRT
jgi:transposase